MATLIMTDGICKEVKPSNGKTFSLEELQGFAGGYIEIVRLDNYMCLIVNEEGLLEELDVNIKASKIASIYKKAEMLIVGNALYCSNKELN